MNRKDFRLIWVKMLFWWWVHFSQIGAVLSMELRLCSSIWSTTQTWLNMTCHQQREVRKKYFSALWQIKLLQYLIAPHLLRCSLEFPSVWICAEALIGGSPCPAELTKKLITSLQLNTLVGVCYEEKLNIVILYFSQKEELNLVKHWNKNIDFIMQFRFYIPGGEFFKGLKGISKTYFWQ